MTTRALFDKIDLHLVRVLHTLLTERNVSRAAVRLGVQQPAVSASLRRLRALTGDDLLVRSGSGMVPTEHALTLIEPAASLLREAERLFASAEAFDPATTARTFRIAAADYLDPLFLPRLVAETRRRAPQSRIEIRPLAGDFDWARQFADGRVDLVIGNWPQPPDSLHLGHLIDDEVVCLVSERHPAARRGWTIEQWLAADHVAPAPLAGGAGGVIDRHLAQIGLARHIVARCPHFGTMPRMVAETLLVLTTGRRFCQRFLGQLPVRIVPCPVAFPPLSYYQLWHERSRRSAADAWLRGLVREVAQSLADEPNPAPAGTTRPRAQPLPSR